jgi:hypothetical protein
MLAIDASSVVNLYRDCLSIKLVILKKKLVFDALLLLFYSKRVVYDQKLICSNAAAFTPIYFLWRVLIFSALSGFIMLKGSIKNCMQLQLMRFMIVFLNI